MIRTYVTGNGIKFKVSAHALGRMSFRNIVIGDVKYILDNYDINHYDRNGNPCYIGRLSDGRKLRIVLSQEDLPTMITCINLD